MADGWIKKVWYIYNGIRRSNAICSHMDGLRDYYIEWSKSDGERQMYDIAYMWNLKKCY